MTDFYRVDDLSNGLEPVPIRAMNEWNMDSPSEFEYISEVKLSEETEPLFEQNKGCYCDGKCNTSKHCWCLDSSALVINKLGHRNRHLCSPESCKCDPMACQNQISDCRTTVPFEVFYVNPRMKFGVRAMRPIPNGAILFEYAGVLSKSKSSGEHDSYVFSFEHNGISMDLDANNAGNIARFVNHSCAPNLYTDPVIYGKRSAPRIAFIAARNIQPGEQLTIRYGERWWNAKPSIDCHCESPYCEYADNVERLAAINVGVGSGVDHGNNEEEVIELSDG